MSRKPNAKSPYYPYNTRAEKEAAEGSPSKKMRGCSCYSNPDSMEIDFAVGNNTPTGKEAIPNDEWWKFFGDTFDFSVDSLPYDENEFRSLLLDLTNFLGLDPNILQTRCVLVGLECLEGGPEDYFFGMFEFLMQWVADNSSSIPTDDPMLWLDENKNSNAVMSLERLIRPIILYIIRHIEDII